MFWRTCCHCRLIRRQTAHTKDPARLGQSAGQITHLPVQGGIRDGSHATDDRAGGAEGPAPGEALELTRSQHGENQCKPACSLNSAVNWSGELQSQNTRRACGRDKKDEEKRGSPGTVGEGWLWEKRKKRWRVCVDSKEVGGILEGFVATRTGAPVHRHSRARSWVVSI